MVPIRILLLVMVIPGLIFQIQPVCYSQTETVQPPAPLPLNARPEAPDSDVPPIIKLDENRVQLGNIIVDTEKKEVTVPGRILQDQTLEFLATTKNGMKSYESAMELDTNATTFNISN